MKHSWLKGALMGAAVIFGANGSFAAAEVELVYDKTAGTLTDGTWVLTASGETNKITITGLSSVGDGSVDIDLSLPIQGGGCIMSLKGLGKGVGIKSVKLPETLTYIGGLSYGTLSNIPKISPLFPSNLVTLARNGLERHYAVQTGNFRIGFAKDADGNILETTMNEVCFDRAWKMGPKLEFGPGVKTIPRWSFIEMGRDYGGPLELWLGPNVKFAGGTALKSIGNVCGTEASSTICPVTVHFEGDMFDGSSMMFSGTTYSGTTVTQWGPQFPVAYAIRFYIGADGCTQWIDFLSSTEGEDRKIIPWDELGDIKEEYWKQFPKETFGRKHPYGLTTDAAVMTNGFKSAYGLPANQWVFSLQEKSTAFVIRIQ